MNCIIIRANIATALSIRQKSLVHPVFEFWPLKVANLAVGARRVLSLRLLNANKPKNREREGERLNQSSIQSSATMAALGCNGKRSHAPNDTCQ